MKTLVINLPTSTDRLASLRERLRKHPYIQPEIIEAIDGRILSSTERDKVFDSTKFQKRYHRPPRPGEIGCTLSHQKAYRNIIANPCNTLILEDDIYITRNFKKELNEIDQWLSESDHPRICFFGVACLYRGKRTYSLSSELRKRMVTPYREICGTYAYAINPQAAHQLLHERPFFTSDDFVLFARKGKIEMKVCLPIIIMPATESQAPSTIVSGQNNGPQYSFAARLHFFINEKINDFLTGTGILKRLNSIDFRPT